MEHQLLWMISILYCRVYYHRCCKNIIREHTEMVQVNVCKPWRTFLLIHVLLEVRIFSTFNGQPYAQAVQTLGNSFRSQLSKSCALYSCSICTILKGLYLSLQFHDHSCTVVVELFGLIDQQ
eukprot:Gb_35757 [translate_table: standard]